MKNTKHRDPMKTKTGKTRLGPLSLSQLEELIMKTQSAKEKGRLRARADQLRSRQIINPDAVSV